MEEKVTLEEMNSLASQMAALRDEKEQVESELKAINEKLSQVKQTLVSRLEVSGMKSYKSPYGLVTMVEKESFITPKTWEEKEAYMAFLRSQDGGEDLVRTMISFNSQTVNSFARDVLKKREADLDLNREIPGLAGPTSYKDISFRTGK